jgi:O-antigen/teichoic acid export membrane protein
VIKHFLNKYSHTNWALVDQGMVSAANFITGILLARLLGIQEFGKFTLVWMIILFINSIQMAMISSPMMSIGPKFPRGRFNNYYRGVFTQQVFFSVISFISVIFWVKISGLFFPSWEVEQLAFPLALVSFFYQNQDFIRRYYFVNKRASYAFFNDVISYLGQVILLILLSNMIKLNTTEVLYIISFTSALAVFQGIVNIRPKFSRPTVTYVTVKRHWLIAKWMTGSAVLQWFSGNFFIIVASSVLGTTAVGAIKSSQNIVGILNILVQAMENFVPVQASNAFKERGINGLKKYINKVSLIGSVGIGGGVVFVCAFSEYLLAKVYGNDYTPYSLVLCGMAIVNYIGFLGTPIASGLRVLDKTKVLFTAFIYSTIFSLMFAYIVVVYWGIYGTVLGIIVSKIVLVGIILGVYVKETNLVKRK